MNIVVLDHASLGNDYDMTSLEALGTVTVYEDTLPEQMIERLKDADAAISNRSVYDKRVLDGVPNLKYIGLTATGTNTVDLPYAKSKGIVTTNVKGYSSQSVIQQTFALYFAVATHLLYFDRFVKEGQCTAAPAFSYMNTPFHELTGKTWGIVGLGAIGRGVAEIVEKFGCKVVYYSTSGRNNTDDYERVDLDTLLKTCDVISVHAPLNDATRGLLGEEELKKMKKSAILVNVGRGPIVVETALAKALDEDWIAGAGLDVFEKEPMPAESPLLKLKNPDKIVMTPHVAWASVEARKTLSAEVAANLEAFMKGESRNVV